MACRWVALTREVDSAHLMVRRDAERMADPNTVLHRLPVSNAVGATPMSAQAAAARTRAQQERG